MPELSRRRPARGGLVATLALAAAISPAAAQTTSNPHASFEDLAAGEKLFRIHCGRCHGQDATGDLGPDLTTGRVLARGEEGLFRVIADGIPNTLMPPMFRTRPDRSVWQLVAYVRSLSLTPANLSLPGDPAEGEAVFRGRDCGTCHMVAGKGGRLGPDLTRIGERRAPEALKADLVRPDADVQPRWWSLRVTHADGTRIEGMRMDEDTYGVRILDADENLWSFAKRELRRIERLETSTMPSYEGTLSDEELDDLIAYLYSLRRTEIPR